MHSGWPQAWEILRAQGWSLGLKANQGDLLSIYDGSSFAQIMQLTMQHNPLQYYYHLLLMHFV